MVTALNGRAEDLLRRGDPRAALRELRRESLVRDPVGRPASGRFGAGTRARRRTAKRWQRS